MVDAWFRALPFVPQSRSELDSARSQLEDGTQGNRHPEYAGQRFLQRPQWRARSPEDLSTRPARRSSGRRRPRHGAGRELDSAGRTSEGPPLALELAQGLNAQIALAKVRPDSALAELAALRIEGWYELTFVSPFYCGGAGAVLPGGAAPGRRAEGGSIGLVPGPRREHDARAGFPWAGDPCRGAHPSGHSGGPGSRHTLRRVSRSLAGERPGLRPLLDQAMEERAALPEQTQ